MMGSKRTCWSGSVGVLCGKPSRHPSQGCYSKAPRRGWVRHRNLFSCSGIWKPEISVDKTSSFKCLTQGRMLLPLPASGCFKHSLAWGHISVVSAFITTWLSFFRACLCASVSSNVFFFSFFLCTYPNLHPFHLSPSSFPLPLFPSHALHFSSSPPLPFSPFSTTSSFCFCFPVNWIPLCNPS